MATGNTKLRVDVDANTAKFNAAMREMRKQGIATGADLDKRLAAANANVAAQASKAQAGLMGMMNVSKGGRFVLQNTAAQLGDMAVQFEMGTSAARIMAQQLPKVFGGFSALGGALGLVLPLLGTVAAVGIPLAAMLLTVGGDAEDSADSVKTFAERLEDAKSAVERAQAAMKLAARGGAEDLREIYGEVTKKVTELVGAMADIERRAAGQKVSEALDASGMAEASKILEGVISDRRAALSELQSQQAALRGALGVLQDRRAAGGLVSDTDFAEFQSQLDEVGAALAALPSIPEAVRVAEAIATMEVLQKKAEQASDAGRWKEAADALSEMRRIAEEMGAQQLADDLTLAENNARHAAGVLEDGKDAAGDLAGAASDIAPAIADANAEALALVGNLRNAMAELARVTQGIQTAQRRAAAQARIRQETIGAPVEREGRLARENYNEESGAAAYAMIRSGNTSRLDSLATTADGIERGARAVAEAEEALRAAEDAYAEGLRASRDAGGSGGGGKGKAAPEADDILARGARELEQMQRRIEMVGKTEDEVAALQLQYRLLDEARKKGIDLDAQSATTGESVRQAIARQADEMQRLAQAHQDAQGRAQAFANVSAQLEDVLVDTFMGATDSVKDFGVPPSGGPV